MTTAPNVYTEKPAYPVLAHSLLTPESKKSDQGRPHSDTNQDDWNLKEDWEAGIRSSGTGIFRCGTVLGFSRLRNRSRENDEYVGQIPRHLLATHLLRHAPSPDTSAFIVHPSNFDALAPRTLLRAVQSAGTGISKEDAIKRLDSVQLLPVHNFPNAAQAIGQVSQSLSEIADRRHQQQQQEHNQPVILIVVGLDTLAEGIIRASNPVKGTALLAATLRNLTRLSRAYASFLSVILVNTNGLGPTTFESDKQPDSNQPKGSETTEDTRSLRDDGILSIFQSTEPSLLSNLLMKTLDQGIDTHILLSDVKVTTVAEVIKDRFGAGVGKWGIWSSKS